MKKKTDANYHPVWLRELPSRLPKTLKTPFDAASFEISEYLRLHPGIVPVIPVSDETLGEGYIIEKEEKRTVIRGGPTGILYGTYAYLQSLILKETPPEGLQEPAVPFRMLNCWDNMDGSIERGYAGRSLWFENGRFCYDAERICQLGRMLSSVGINVLCINNVNVHAPAQSLLDDLLLDAAAFASILRPFGIRLMFSIDFSMPLHRGLSSADPLDQTVCDWWKLYAAGVWKAIPDLAGFLVKADSEHRPGPNTYGRSHADGANMLADAVRPYGGVLVWRAFVYNCMQDWRDYGTDRPCAAFDVYHPLDGQFRENVILQVKYGPFDFQVREPVSPLFSAMEKTALCCELQLTQEYTGHQIDLYAMPPQWWEIFDEIPEGRLCAAAAVSNLGRDYNWTGHPFAALNLFAFGQYAWNPGTDPEQVIESWIRMTYELPEEEKEELADLLSDGRRVYEKYTSPLGLCWMVNPGGHYGPSPYGYEFQAWGTYNRADRTAVGIDRTRTGTGVACQYAGELEDLYSDPETCPEELLLFFHRLPYTFRMRDGRTLVQRIYDDHFEGYEQVRKMQDRLQKLSVPGPDREEVVRRMEMQCENAREWCDVVNTFFHRLSGLPDALGRRIYP